ncbi:GAF and ANTAR domain-containing protein [Actinoplanes sp. NPDC023936]|uniref:GAF and ANTAR domain-containing protein n=1 Tax=Actinoplanes sp. NPDC023936 TaxID=3154910 RepID=UPI0033D9522D
MNDRVARIRGLIEGAPSAPGHDGGLLHRVCAAATHTLAASGTGVSVMTEVGARGVYAASDPLTERMEELQFVLGEGPCWDAFALRRPVLVPDIEEESPGRWPMYRPAAWEGGIRAVFSFPLQMGAVRLGVLDVFRKRTGSLRGDEFADALAFAEVTMTALLDRHEEAVMQGLGDSLDDAGEHRAELFQAQGMVMVQLGVSIGEAMVRMRAYAFAHGRRLDEVARDVVARRLDFGSDRP